MSVEPFDASDLDLVVADRVLRFVVLGVPIAQGSKTFVPTAAGPRSKESNEAKLKPWRASISDQAAKLVSSPLKGPVAVRATFVFPRPKSHYRTGKASHVLRDASPYWHVSMPDLDKLQRAIGDALAGVVLVNDSQIARWLVRKTYGDQPRAMIEIEQLTTPVEAIFS